ncbi:uncharacterized protein LOC128861323 [Anastrepha ludens]|uniref:uncharacterized protein LOC128861323 n=1 Tax=Anastrepha ludens TaxID=28586 RepID=UPI0023B0506E|nr:uncharacterized protein LOC128861323 [Anastrepha ludens]
MTKYLLGVALCGFIVFVVSHPQLEEELYKNSAPEYPDDAEGLIKEIPIILLLRLARSPAEESFQENKNGRVELKYEETPERGREASFKYSQHLLRSDDGNFGLDAYAQGKRNYDFNQNDFQGGLEGHWYFKR